jgi:hypothetical protein
MKPALQKVVSDSKDFATRFSRAVVRDLKFKLRTLKGYKYFDAREVSSIKDFVARHSQVDTMRDSPTMIEKMKEWVLTQKGGKYISRSMGNLMLVMSPAEDQNTFLVDYLEVYYRDINPYDMQIFVRVNCKGSGEFLAYDYFVNDLIVRIAQKTADFLEGQSKFLFEDILERCLRSRYDKDYFRMLLFCLCEQAMQKPTALFKIKSTDPAEIYGLEEEIELAEDPFKFLDQILELFGDISTTKSRIMTSIELLKAIATINHYENRTESVKNLMTGEHGARFFNDYAAITFTHIEVL